MVDWSPFADLDVRRPGVVVGVLHDGEPPTWASFGAAEPLGHPLTSSSPLYVASVAKQFTAAAIAALILKGTVGEEDAVLRWLPELRAEWKEVRLRHLLSHTGGLRESNIVDASAGWGVDSRFTTWDRVAVIAATAPQSSPGTVHRYSNHGYVLLAAVVERASGEVFGDFARGALLEPAGMVSSRFLDVPGDPPGPGWAGGSRRIDVRFTCVGDGGLIATLDDLARWSSWLPRSSLAPLMLATRPALPNGRVAHDAWGISIRTHHGLRIESHGGSFDGYMASLVRFPEPGRSIVVLANTDELGIQDFGWRTRQLADSLLGDQLDLTRPPWTETHGDPLDG